MYEPYFNADWHDRSHPARACRHSSRPISISAGNCRAASPACFRRIDCAQESEVVHVPGTTYISLACSNLGDRAAILRAAIAALAVGAFPGEQNLFLLRDRTMNRTSRLSRPAVVPQLRLSQAKPKASTRSSPPLPAIEARLGSQKAFAKARACSISTFFFLATSRSITPELQVRIPVCWRASSCLPGAFPSRRVEDAVAFTLRRITEADAQLSAGPRQLSSD